MTIYDAPNLTSGIDDTIVSVITAVPAFTPMLLVFIYGTVLIGGAVSQKRRLGTADIPMWSTIAAIATLMVALPLTLNVGFIQLEVLSIIVVVTIFSGLWLFLDRNRNEV
ncbi:hypothetical protein CMI37_21805 [Candidatus Pacearchaeota archaeon]|nr:hypothetical protein [Candidatus Pacearchaeota archaeon]|tara:strand:- start:830 stop:1159 length:330 start_codon:yes stop_codon:yes gene_type:complete